jgi:hypothetical protein
MCGVAATRPEGAELTARGVLAAGRAVREGFDPVEVNWTSLAATPAGGRRPE